MSLRVWLPLTKDLRNQGLDDVTVTNNGATFNSTGKLGGCYSFGTSNSYITVDSTPLKTFTEFSFACWVKIISWNTNYSTIFAAKNSTAVSWNNLIFSLLRDSSSSALCFNISNGSNYTSNSCRTEALSLDTWYHITCTYKSGQIKLYQNGNVVSVYNTNVVPNFNSVVNLWIGKSNENSYQSNNLLNDVRFYDHCLSPMEVKEISKGLVLHYPLKDKWCETVTNKAGTGFSGWNNSGAATRTSNDTTIPNPPTPGPVGSMIITTAGNCAVQIGTTATSGFASKTLTFSIWVWLGQTQDSNTIYIRSLKTDGNIGNFEYNGSTNPSTWPKEKWLYLTKTITAASDATGFYICTYQNVLNQKRAFNGWQVEEGSHANPWTAPGTTRAASTVEYDCSGFCNNGTRIGTFSWTSDTPKYNVSTIFTEGCSISTINNLSNPCSEFTIAGWVNLMDGYVKNNGCHLISFGGTYCRICISKDGQAVRILLTNGSTNYVGGSILKDSALTANKWNYFVITFKNGVIKIYINGLLDADLTATITQINFPSSNISIGQHGSEKPNAKVSDFRFYVTALSADDVKSLYNNSAYIDNQGNIYGAVYEEV